jgi:excisionase family DNA binding protein
MKQAFKTIYTDQEFRQLIREELKAVLSGEAEQIAGPDNDGFINLKQAVDFLKIKTSYMYQLVHKKAIPFKKSGKRLLFKKSDLAAWVSNGNKIAEEK